MIESHQPPTVINRWWRGVGARVVLELVNVVASCGPFGAPPKGLKAKRTRKSINKGQFTAYVGGCLGGQITRYKSFPALVPYFG